MAERELVSIAHDTSDLPAADLASPHLHELEGPTVPPTALRMAEPMCPNLDGPVAAHWIHLYGTDALTLDIAVAREQRSEPGADCLVVLHPLGVMIELQVPCKQ